MLYYYIISYLFYNYFVLYYIEIILAQYYSILYNIYNKCILCLCLLYYAILYEHILYLYYITHSEHGSYKTHNSQKTERVKHKQQMSNNKKTNRTHTSFSNSYDTALYIYKNKSNNKKRRK